jgi:hypothetical protein
MSRDVCGVCWGTYDDNGLCECKPVKVINHSADEALLRQALKTLEQCYEALPLIFAKDIEPVIDTLKERLK